MPSKLVSFVLLLACTAPLMSQTTSSKRPRAREAGVVVGILPPGPLNAITDVAGVRVGQATVTEGDSVRTGVTAILPHAGNVFRERVPAAIHVGNGFGKLLGVTQVRELGELETPILLTCTLCVWKAADAMVQWLLDRPEMERVRSINPVVGETNDGFLNDIRVRPIRPEHVVRALESASGGPVAEGAVGAGAGTVAFGWKGGIGTSSRRLPERMGGYTVGVLVQTNFGGVLTINGAPVGRELGRYAFGAALEAPPGPGSGSERPGTGTGTGAGTFTRTFTGTGVGSGGSQASSVSALTGAEPSDGRPGDAHPHAHAHGSSGAGPGRSILDRDAAGFSADGSIMIVVATDAPLDARKLDRLAVRALGGLARTGASMTNGSGDYVIAFSTAESVRRREGREPRDIADLPNDAMSPLFQAAAEATEEAIYNSLFKATTVSGHRGTVEALPLDKTLDILEKYGVLHWDRTLPPGGGGR